MKFARNVAIALLVIFVLAVVGGLIAESVVASRTLTPVLEDTAANIAKAWPKVEADFERLSKQPLLTSAKPASDAGAVLNKALRWRTEPVRQGGLQKRYEGLSEGLKTLAQEAADPARAIDDEVKAELQALDFGWLKDLANHGHWSLRTASPLAEMKPVRVASAPFPDLMVLNRLARLRLYRGIVDEDVATAAREVQHLGYLALTTEHLVATMVGVALISASATMHPTGEVSSDDAEAMKRLFYGSPAFATWAAPDAARAKFSKLAAAKLPLARCVAWSEAGLHYTLKPYLEGRFETFYAELDAVTPGEGCRFDLLLPIRAESERDPYALMENDIDDPETGGNAAFIARVPIARGIVGSILGGISSPNWLAAYH